MTPQLFILTGGSRGMGLAMAQQILQQGHRLIIISRHTTPELAKLALSHNTQLTHWQHDLADPGPLALRLQAWLQAEPATHYARAVLINNAGVIPPIAPLSQTDWSAIAQGLRVGLEAPMVLTAAFLQATEAWPIRRQVLNVSSGLGRRALASQATYCAAKAGLDNFSASVALDEARKANGALICSLAPGVIDTDMQVQLRTASSTQFPDVDRFIQLEETGSLTSAEAAARKVLTWLERSDFGQPVIADVRNP